jgi:hypothetical protein
MKKMNRDEELELKREYNKVLKRHHKAALYMDDCNVPISQRETFLPEYKNIIDRLNTILNIFEINKIEYSTKEGLGGFDLIAEELAVYNTKKAG